MKELKEICRKILTETKPNTRKSHPLYNDNITHIIETYNRVFENRTHLPPVQKITGLFNELFREHSENDMECQVCKLFRRSTIVGHVNSSHGLSSGEYRKLYNMELISDSIKKKLSEKIKGDKNPAYQHGGKFSAFSKNFVKYQDKTEEEVTESIKEVCEKSSISNRENGNNDTTLIYWMSKGYSEEDAKKAISERQATFSLEKCIEKYGEVVGKQRWLDRQEKWHKSFKKSNFSKVSQKLFNELLDLLPSSEFVYFATLQKDTENIKKNNEYRLRLKDRLILPDFIDLNTNRIIEFDGDYWHGRDSNVLCNAPFWFTSLQ